MNLCSFNLFYQKKRKISLNLQIKEGHVAPHMRHLRGNNWQRGIEDYYYKKLSLVRDTWDSLKRGFRSKIEREKTRFLFSWKKKVLGQKQKLSGGWEKSIFSVPLASGFLTISLPPPSWASCKNATSHKTQKPSSSIIFLFQNPTQHFFSSPPSVTSTRPYSLLLHSHISFLFIIYYPNHSPHNNTVTRSNFPFPPYHNSFDDDCKTPP